MGELDLLQPLLEELGTIHFGRVLMKPGKPLTFATVPYTSRGPLVCRLAFLGARRLRTLHCSNRWKRKDRDRVRTSR